MLTRDASARANASLNVYLNSELERNPVKVLGEEEVAKRGERVSVVQHGC